MTQLMCSKGGEDEVCELLPRTSIVRDWYEPQGYGDLSSPGAPAEQGGDCGAGSAPFSRGRAPPWQSSEQCWVQDLVPSFGC